MGIVAQPVAHSTSFAEVGVRVLSRPVLATAEVVIITARNSNTEIVGSKNGNGNENVTCK